MRILSTTVREITRADILNLPEVERACDLKGSVVLFNCALGRKGGGVSVFFVNNESKLQRCGVHVLFRLPCRPPRETRCEQKNKAEGGPKGQSAHLYTGICFSF
jgi:hypothetical protein